MRIVYWIALALGIALIVYVVVFGYLVVSTRLNSPWPMDCKPIGLIGIGCSSPDGPGFLYEATVAIRLMIGGFLVWAFFRHRRHRRGERATV